MVLKYSYPKGGLNDLWLWVVCNSRRISASESPIRIIRKLEFGPVGRRDRRYYIFGLIVLAGNIFLTITDEFGWFDLIVLILYISLFILLLVSRAHYRAAVQGRDAE